MMRFEGDLDFPQTQAEVFAQLSNVRFLVGCVPDVESVKSQEGDVASLVLRPGFAFVRGTLEVTMRVTDAVPPNGMRVILHSKGIGSSADVEAGLALSGHEGGTRVHWTAEVKSLGGLLKLVPTGLIRG